MAHRETCCRMCSEIYHTKNDCMIVDLYVLYIFTISGNRGYAWISAWIPTNVRIGELIGVKINDHVVGVGGGPTHLKKNSVELSLIVAR